MKTHNLIMITILILGMISCSTTSIVHLPARAILYSSLNTSEELQICVLLNKDKLHDFSPRKIYGIYYQLEESPEQQYDEYLWIENQYISLKPSKEVKYFEDGGMLMNTIDQSIGVFNCKNAIVIIIGLNTNTYAYQSLPEN